MKQKIWKNGLKCLSFILCFLLVFAVLQFMFDLVNSNGKSALGFYRLEEQSVDVLFLGPSQMYCAVDAQKLTEEYGISSYDFGEGGQYLTTTYYYLQEALKSQTPKVVFVEMASAFVTGDFGDGNVALNYDLMPLTAEKYQSLKANFGDSPWRAAWYCVPLLSSHTTWNQTNPLGMVWNVLNYNKGYEKRGFAATDAAEQVEIAYLQEEEGEVPSFYKKTTDAILDIAELCEQNGIRLVFFKVPVGSWTRSDSAAVSAFMEEHHLFYLEMNDYLDEMGIDGQTDFANSEHLNISGAEKTTDFLVDYLRDLL